MGDNESRARPTRRDMLRYTTVGAVGIGLGWRLQAEEAPPAEPVQEAYYAEMRRRWMDAGHPPIPRTIFFGEFWSTVCVRYRTDPERIARILPPPLEPDETSPDVLMNWFLTVNDRANMIAVSPSWTYGESDVFVAVNYRGHRAMLEISLNLNADIYRVRGRERSTLGKMDSRVSVDHFGNRVRAWSSRQGHVLAAIETVATDEPAHPVFWHREAGWGWLKYGYRLNPDWHAPNPFSSEPIMLWRIGGNDAGYPSDLPKGVDPTILPRACDVSKTRLEFDTSFPLNTYCEFPVREILGVSFYTGFGTKPLQVRVPRGPEGTTQGRGVPGYQQIEEIDPNGLEPWCLAAKSYDRPISAGKVWVPAGWPERTTALKLTSEELRRYRSREQLALDPVQLVDISYEIDPAVHAQIVPPITTPGARPLLRILGLRVESSDLSTRPFTELWLLGRCEVEAQPTWYAMSHIVGWDGDVINGREIFGYPSKLGAPELFFDPLEVSVYGRRVHRDFFYATVPLSLEALAPAEERLEILGLQTRALKKRETPFWGDWILQPWSIQLEEGRVARPEEVVLAFPTDPAPGDIGMTDPWFELAGGKVVRVVAGRGRVLRFPGRYAGEVEPQTLERFTYERHDGISNMLGGAPPRGTPTRSTFLVRDLAVPGATGSQTPGE